MWLRATYVDVGETVTRDVFSLSSKFGMTRSVDKIYERLIDMVEGRGGQVEVEEVQLFSFDGQRHPFVPAGGYYPCRKVVEVVPLLCFYTLCLFALLLSISYNCLPVIVIVIIFVTFTFCVNVNGVHIGIAHDPLNVSPPHQATSSLEIKYS